MTPGELSRFKVRARSAFPNGCLPEPGDVFDIDIGFTPSTDIVGLVISWEPVDVQTKMRVKAFNLYTRQVEYFLVTPDTYKSYLRYSLLDDTATVP